MQKTLQQIDEMVIRPLEAAFGAIAKPELEKEAKQTFYDRIKNYDDDVLQKTVTHCIDNLFKFPKIAQFRETAESLLPRVFTPTETKNDEVQKVSLGLSQRYAQWYVNNHHIALDIIQQGADKNELYEVIRACAFIQCQVIKKQPHAIGYESWGLGLGEKVYTHCKDVVLQNMERAANNYRPDVILTPEQRAWLLRHKNATVVKKVAEMDNQLLHNEI